MSFGPIYLANNFKFCLWPLSPRFWRSRSKKTASSRLPKE